MSAVSFDKLKQLLIMRLYFAIQGSRDSVSELFLYGALRTQCIPDTRITKILSFFKKSCEYSIVDLFKNINLVKHSIR